MAPRDTFTEVGVGRKARSEGGEAIRWGHFFAPTGRESADTVNSMKKFRGKVRYFRPEKASGLAVIDIPADVAKTLGGLKQMRVKGTLKGVEYTSNTMPAGGGVLALSVSKKLLDSAGLRVGDMAQVEIESLT